MMNEVKQITDMILSRVVCNDNTFIDYRRKIDERYLPAFETNWMECFTKLSSLQLNSEEMLLMDTLRETAFRVTYEISSDPELAGLVSDDFELIGKAAALNIQMPWLNGLWLSYMNGVFPHGEVQAVEGELRSLIA